MLLLEYAKSRLEACLTEIQHLKEAEFPYKHSEDALNQLESIFALQLNDLRQADPGADPEAIAQLCSVSLGMIFEHLPYLGFVLRSTNVRNAFEVYRPLLRMVSKILNSNSNEANAEVRLLLSSEWDYSPYTYRDIANLPGYILIGLPASESANPLLIPLAGHELGHTLWLKEQMHSWIRPRAFRSIESVLANNWQEFQNLFPAVNTNPANLLYDLQAARYVELAYGWVMRQSEETFCDFVGLRTFGSSYLHAFTYLLSPNIPFMRSEEYPSQAVRGTNLATAANTFQIDTTWNPSILLSDNPGPPLTPEDAFLLSVADQSLESLVSDLIAKVDQILTAVSIELPSPEEVIRIRQRFDLGVPADKCHSLPATLEAGWQTFHTLMQRFQGARSNVELERREREIRNTKELVLKNIEVYEYEQIVTETR